MWQITWMLSFIPPWFWNFLFFVGVGAVIVAWIFKFIPFISTYRLPIQVIGILSIITSIWFLGAASNEEKWQAEIKKAEEKIKELEQKSNDINEQLKISQAETEKIRQEKSKSVIKYLDKFVTKEIIKEVEGPERVRIEEVIKFIERCPIPKELIDAHNAGARGDGIKK